MRAHVRVVVVVVRVCSSPLPSPPRSPLEPRPLTHSLCQMLTLDGIDSFCYLELLSRIPPFFVLKIMFFVIAFIVRESI